MIAEPYIGAHVSIRGGYAQAARAARESGAGCFQYFPKNPRSLQLKALNAKDAGKCASFCREKGLLSIAHTPYPTNLAAGDGDVPSREVMVKSLLNDLEIAEACGSLGIVVHFGHFHKLQPLQGYQNIIQCINETLQSWNGTVKLLIENQAGNGGFEGTSLEELVKIRELSRYPEKIGFCFDTCHAFAAGIWNPERSGDLLESGYRLDYWPHLAAVHLNDSRYPFSSKRDRHAQIGTGHIGAKSMKELLTSEPFLGKPAVLETEKGPDGTHKNEIAAVRSWFDA
ncbi:deoxyribonuclease IV [Paenibacillus sp. URB8-2]|uniref:deoxyribonuclease IV n=1 Tax=Paenibacillus sp. URB8-2 TaxID=2741301 RepID=UPI0015B90F5D|nr:deoxyribonuclease IV [Paenibacillus sp. URB8-2]BCG59522.1 putative endonuclease 4 [Paenibacillus sp. URB8-2]